MHRILTTPRISIRGSRHVAPLSLSVATGGAGAGISRATSSHSGIQTRPSAPAKRNGPRQPYLGSIQKTTSGAIAPPTLNPTWLIADPTARSDGRKYVAFILPITGMPADSVIPSSTLAATSPGNPRTSAVDAQ